MTHMAWYPDMGRESMVAAGEHVRAVGWLSSAHPFPRGPVPPEFVLRLRELAANSHHCADDVYFGMLMGPHICELCGTAAESRNLGVPAGEVLFVAPAMVAHYVEQHGYAPPPEFIDAVLASPLPGTREYQAATRQFREMHKRQIEQSPWYKQQHGFNT